MKKNEKRFQIRRQTASAIAVVLAVLSPGVFPGGAAMAESAGLLVPVRSTVHMRATGSNAAMVWDEDGTKEEPDEVELEADLATDSKAGLATDSEADSIMDSEAGLIDGLGADLATGSDAELAVDSVLEPDLASASNAQPQPATPSDLVMLTAQTEAAGDLWDDWNGNANFPGEGTREAPYQIETLSHLMGLSESVASGNDYERCYFELTQSLDLGGLSINQGNWNPIGWYRNRAEVGGEVATPFRGHFDGCGNTITGLKITGELDGKTNLGLFGVIDGGTVENLNLQAEAIRGADWTGILAGTVKNGAQIRNITVSGYVYSRHHAGGIAALLRGSGKGTAAGTQVQEADGAVIVENCSAEGIVMNGAETDGAVGGIAGRAEKAYLIDNVVITQNGSSDRIQGKGFVGGIAGVMNLSGIYNSYVNGTIGGNGSRAVGGIVGKYESGNLILARMAGVISRTNAGSASREGTFVGTRDSSDRFTYGTERDSRISYLFTNSLAKAKQVFGSTIDGDNRFSEDAHIGYWSDLERKYKTVAGQIEYDCGDRFFYEELEDGVRYIVTQKLGREFTMEGYKKDLPFAMDHFAPGFMGEPTRGYLVYIPRIDAQNANGTYDTDVAELSAISSTGSSYYREIDKDHPSAIKAGAVVTVVTAPKNTAENRYQMIVELSEAGGVKPPTYLDEEEEKPMQYVGGGAYSFIMPECDTRLNAEYVKVTTKLTADPGQTRISIVQTRSGDRKDPQIVTEVKNEDGILIARYVDGKQDHSVEVQPVRIHAEHNGNGQTIDRTVRWMVDDTDLLDNRSETGYTMKDAVVMPNMNSAFITNIVNREVKAQADNQYREKIRDTVYTRYGVVSAVTNPETSVNHEAIYANCRVAVEFQIVDLTTVRVETLNLNQTEALFTVTRKLTGSCYQPVETISVTGPVTLTAALNPEHPFYEQVSWKDAESGKNLHLEPSGANLQNCRITPVWDPEGETNPAWIQNLISRDRTLKKEKPLEKVTGNGVKEEFVTAVSEDQTHGHIQAKCRVRIAFVTQDETVPRPGTGGTGGGGSSKGSGGGGGGSSTGIASGGVTKAGGPSLPSYVVTGTWVQNAAGQWMFADKERIYAKEWAAVHNPYASIEAGQSAYDWFRFDEAGFLLTGWHQDDDGNRYYLNPVPDGTQGRMLTGWNWIDGQCFYFEEESNGLRGALKRNVLLADGKRTDDNGAWIVDDVVQRQTEEK